MTVADQACRHTDVGSLASYTADTVALELHYNAANLVARALRPRAAQASRHVKPLSNSWGPLRMVTRLQPSSRAARRWPPWPSSLTVRAMKSRRALPLRERAVSMKSVLRESVSSIGVPPAKGYLEHTT